MIPPWLQDLPGIILASRVRAARNLEGVPFRGVLPPMAARDFCDRIRGTWFGGSFQESLDETGSDLAERADHLRVPSDILETGSPWLALRSGSRGMIVLQSDHFRIWAVRSGLDLLGSLEDLAEIEPSLASLGDLARDPEWGWRTASPEDVGTGLRASVLVHAPALWLARRVSTLTDGLEALGGRLTSPWHGEELGSMLIVSNRATLGSTELEIAARVGAWAARISQEEDRAANDLVEHWGNELRDSVHRSDALLASARLLSPSELAQRAAIACLGARLGWLPASRARDAIELLMVTRPGTLRARRSAEIPEGHPGLDDLRASETRRLWGREPR